MAPKAVAKKVMSKLPRGAKKEKPKELAAGYKLMKHQYNILSWVPYALSFAALVSSTLVHHFKLPGYFYTYNVCAAYTLYGMAWSDYFRLGRHKFYVDGVQRTQARGWSQTLLLFFLYPLLVWHLIFNPEYQDQFLAPMWVRQTFLGGMGISLLGTFLIHQMLYLRYWVSLLVRFTDCIAINLQLATGLLGYGQSWKIWPIVALSVSMATASLVLLSLETRIRWISPPANDGVKCGSERSKVEWYRLYVTAGQGCLICVLAPILERGSVVSVSSSLCLLLGLVIFGFGNQFKVELPWNNIDIWHFHDDFHFLICGTQLCTSIVAMRLKAS